jgi:hypothetical protein
MNETFEQILTILFDVLKTLLDYQFKTVDNAS